MECNDSSFDTTCHRLHADSLLDGLQKLFLLCRVFRVQRRYRHFRGFCNMSIRLELLLTTLIYPTIRPRDRSGLGPCRYLALGRYLFSLLAACFRGGATISLPYLGTAHNLLCPLLTSVTWWARLAVRSVSFETRNGSPGVIPATFGARLSDLPNTALQRIEDFVVCCRLVPTVSSLIRLLFVSPHLCLRLPSRLALPLPPCPRLAFASVGAGSRL